jgi:hypothetical protein
MSGKQSRKEVEAGINRQAKRLKSIEVGQPSPEGALPLPPFPSRKALTSALAPTTSHTQDVLAKVRHLAQQCKAEPEQER